MTVREPRARRQLTPLLIVVAMMLVALGPTQAAAASGPTLKLSKTSGPKGTVYSATYSYVPDEGAGCDIRAALEWDGISAGGGFTLLGGTGCRDTAKGLVVPYPPHGSVGKHRVCGRDGCLPPRRSQSSRPLCDIHRDGHETAIDPEADAEAHARAHAKADAEAHPEAHPYVDPYADRETYGPTRSIGDGCGCGHPVRLAASALVGGGTHR